MNTDQDTTRIVRSWLRSDEHESADRVLGVVLARLDATPQRRTWAARRIAMNPYAKLILATAAVLVVAVVGLNVLAVGNPGPGGPTPTPSPSIASPSPSPLAAPPTGQLDAGTYRITELWWTVRPLVFTVPDGWRREENFVAHATGTAEAYEFGGNDVAMATWPISHVYSDSCQWEGTLQKTSTVRDVVEALTQQTGHATTGPTTEELGDHSASRLEFSLPVDFDVAACDGPIVRLWPDAGPKEEFGLPIEPGHTMTVHIVDLDGTPQAIVAVRKEASSAADVAALEQLIASIRFE